MIIRRATPSDAAVVLDIYSTFVRKTAFTFETELPSIEGVAKRIDLVNQKHLWLISEIEGRCVGYAYASEHRNREAYAPAVETSIYMQESYRGKGYGIRIYSSLLDTIKLMGIHTALAIITLPNQASELFHQRLGFTQFADFKNIGYKLGQWHDTRWYRKDLNPYDSSPQPRRSYNQVSADDGIIGLD